MFNYRCFALFDCAGTWKLRIKWLKSVSAPCSRFSTIIQHETDVLSPVNVFVDTAWFGQNQSVIAHAAPNWFLQGNIISLVFRWYFSGDSLLCHRYSHGSFGELFRRNIAWFGNSCSMVFIGIISGILTRFVLRIYVQNRYVIIVRTVTAYSFPGLIGK